MTRYRKYANAIKNRKRDEITIREGGYYKNVLIKSKKKRRGYFEWHKIKKKWDALIAKKK